MGRHRRRSIRSVRSSPGRVTNITDYGAFVELEPGIGPGPRFRNELDQEERPSGKIVSTSQESK